MPRKPSAREVRDVAAAAIALVLVRWKRLDTGERSRVFAAIRELVDVAYPTNVVSLAAERRRRARR